MNLETLCESARKKLERGVAISAGMHAAKLRQHAQQLRELHHVSKPTTGKGQIAGNEGEKT